MLVQGTGFWRAPEVLAELQKIQASDRNVEIWTEKVDVYSYAMTCYEVLTGHVPFFEYVKRVIDGERPHLP
jgi:serine/threonine protein kinase